MILLLQLNHFVFQQTYSSILQLNPQHTVPTLVDGDFVIWESQAICMYLVDKYATDDKLYPTGLRLRAKCNQRMFFVAASLFARLRDLNIPIIWKGATEIPQAKLDSVHEAYGILEAFLASDPFLVGMHVTIPDISAAITVLALETYAPVQADKHPKIVAWLKRLNETIPVFTEINEKASKMLRQTLLGFLEKNKSKSKYSNSPK